MSFSKENQDLLKEKETTESAAPRRNTKKDLIEKIKTLCEEHNLPLTESDTTLARSSKTQLQQMLAAKTEAVIQKKMMDSVKKMKIGKYIKGYQKINYLRMRKKSKII